MLRRVLKVSALGLLAGGTLGAIYTAATAFSPSPPNTPESITRDGGVPLKLRDGRLVEYFVHGDPNADTTIFALHGANTTGKLFALLDAWAKKNRVRIVSPTLPGYGRSDHFGETNGNVGVSRNGGYSLQTWVEDAKEVLAHAGVNDFHLVGTSFGSLHAAALASLYPKQAQLKNVMLYVAFAPYDSRAVGGHDPLAGSVLEMFGKMRDKPLWKRCVEKAVFMPILRSVVPKDGDVFRSIAHQWEGSSSCTDILYQPWDFPWQNMATNRKVFVVSGSKDNCAPPHNQAKLVKEVKNSVLVTYDGTHEYPLQHPEIMEQHFERLLRGE